MTATAPTSPGSALPRAYLAWVGAAAVSRAGDAALYFALGWAASSHGAAAAGLVVTAVVAPRTVLLLLGGAVGDRHGPRAVVVAGAAALLVSTVLLTVLVLDVGTPLWLLLAAALVEGVVTAFSLPASGAMPRSLVPDPALPRALALRQASAQVADLVGGPLGGLLVGLAGLAAVAGANAATFAVVLVVLVLVRPTRPVPAPPVHPLLHQAREGVSTAMALPVVRAAVLLTGVAAGVVLPSSAVLVPVLVRERGWDPEVGGLVLGAQAAGALVVALVVSRWGVRRRAGLVAAAGLGLTAASLLLLAVAPTTAAALVAGTGVGAGLSVFTSHTGPLVLAGSPPTHLSRVQAVLGLAQAAALLLSTPLLGVVAALLGAPATTAVCAGLLGLTASAGLLSRPFRRAGAP